MDTETERAKERLRDLREHMPGENEGLYQFGAYLAERMGETITPGAFNLSFVSAIHSLRYGHDFPTESYSLLTQPQAFFTGLKSKLVSISKAAFSKEFSEEVQRTSERIKRVTE